MKSKLISSIISIIIIVAIIGLSIWFMNKPTQVTIQGQVDATQINVSPKIAGRLEQVLIKEGDMVKEGDLLAVLSTPELDAKLVQAESAKAAAEAQDKKAKKGTRTEQIQGAYNQWQQAKASAELADKTYERMQNLYNDKVISAQKRDEAYTQSKASRELEKAAYANYKMAINGSRSEDKEAASAQVNQAQGAIEEVLAYKKEAKVLSPSNAEVLKIIPNRGEVVSAGYPIVNLVDLNDVWVVFNIKENLMSSFKKGSTFEAQIPALNNKKIKLQVRYIAAQGDFATWSATKTQGDFDMKTFEIKAYPMEKVEGLRPGMSALVDEKSLKKD
ncbi:biotin/lipoyl-binding protein [Apibacter sp. B3706]|uniref:HlyD family secretion protein n=1 Tax=Apibacter TaxID=1778601 RepID=UPI001328EE7C|nr:MULTISPECIES: HlyD family secretion protein [Apibacter]MCX8677186.1 efflux RND transporter periplasmic adaptor subunit [Apibacter sp. B3919]MXO24434.1 biotin/lipoyl-binding protein [Apibacter sp. B3924]MXO25678.1 biotin/lipoyl-binding protein [Apibacter sp. B3813]MXO27629.1 biotin/lipoyl-binding protein [Apibacter sp. B3913]MXO30011.1 biotin/lipoyl-binding protein [Apibacter sp. B3912]